MGVIDIPEEQKQSGIAIATTIHDLLRHISINNNNKDYIQYETIFTKEGYNIVNDLLDDNAWYEFNNQYKFINVVPTKLIAKIKNTIAGLQQHNNSDKQHCIHCSDHNHNNNNLHSSQDNFIRQLKQYKSQSNDNNIKQQQHQRQYSYILHNNKELSSHAIDNIIQQLCNTQQQFTLHVNNNVTQQVVLQYIHPPTLSDNYTTMPQQHNTVLQQQHDRNDMFNKLRRRSINQYNRTNHSNNVYGQLKYSVLSTTIHNNQQHNNNNNNNNNTSPIKNWFKQHINNHYNDQLQQHTLPDTIDINEIIDVYVTQTYHHNNNSQQQQTIDHILCITADNKHSHNNNNSKLTYQLQHNDKSIVALWCTALYHIKQRHNQLLQLSITNNNHNSNSVLSNNIDLLHNTNNSSRRNTAESLVDKLRDVVIGNNKDTTNKYSTTYTAEHRLSAYNSNSTTLSSHSRTTSWLNDTFNNISSFTHNLTSKIQSTTQFNNQSLLQKSIVDTMYSLSLGIEVKGYFYNTVDNYHIVPLILSYTTYCTCNNHCYNGSLQYISIEDQDDSSKLQYISLCSITDIVLGKSTNTFKLPFTDAAQSTSCFSIIIHNNLHLDCEASQPKQCNIFIIKLKRLLSASKKFKHGLCTLEGAELLQQSYSKQQYSNNDDNHNKVHNNQTINKSKSISHTPNDSDELYDSDNNNHHNVQQNNHNNNSSTNISSNNCISYTTPYTLSLRNNSVHQPQHITIVNQYKLLHRIGFGYYGNVYSAMHMLNNTQYAVKVIESNRVIQNKHSTVHNELHYMNALSHSNLVQYIDSFTTVNKTDTSKIATYIVTEYCELGSLSDIIHITQCTLTESQISYIIYQLLLAIQYIHTLNYVHCDIKGQNILLNSNGQVKLTDLGSLQCLVNNDNHINDVVRHMTKQYIPPELVDNSGSNNRLTKAIDVYATGITCIELSRANDRLNNSDDSNLLSNWHIELSNNNRSTELIDFIQQCIITDAIQRPSVEQLLTHTFITQYNTKPTYDSIQQLLHFVQPIVERYRVLEQQQQQQHQQQVFLTRQISNSSDIRQYNNIQHISKHSKLKISDGDKQEHDKNTTQHRRRRSNKQQHQHQHHRNTSSSISITPNFTSANEATIQSNMLSEWLTNNHDNNSNSNDNKHNSNININNDKRPYNIQNNILLPPNTNGVLVDLPVAQPVRKII